MGMLQGRDMRWNGGRRGVELGDIILIFRAVASVVGGGHGPHARVECEGIGGGTP